MCRESGLVWMMYSGFPKVTVGLSKNYIQFSKRKINTENILALLANRGIIPRVKYYCLQLLLKLHVKIRRFWQNLSRSSLDHYCQLSISPKAEGKLERSGRMWRWYKYLNRIYGITQIMWAFLLESNLRSHNWIDDIFYKGLKVI